MSVIFGKYHINKSPLPKSDLEKMQHRLNHWNADDSGIWKNDFVGFGHLMLWNTPESLYEKLPFTSPYSGNVITADARIDNREELFSKLKITDHTVPDSFLILQAYDKYGKDCVHHLIGDFAFAIWDKHKEELFCARDHMGVRPFFYYYDGECFAWASEMKGLLCLDEVSEELDERYITNIICTGAYDLSTTPYENIKELKSSTTISVTKNRIKTPIYWDLDVSKEIKLKKHSDYIEQFDFLLSQAVERRMRTVYPIGAQLSGGLDSSGIVAIINEKIKHTNQDLHTYSFHLPDEYLGKVFPYKDERDLILEHQKFNNLQNVHFISGKERKYTDDLKLMIKILDGPTIAWTGVMADITAEYAKNQNVRTLFSGYLGDELVTYRFNGHAELIHNHRYLTLFNNIIHRNGRNLKTTFRQILSATKSSILRKPKNNNSFRNETNILLKEKYIKANHRKIANEKILSESPNIRDIQYSLTRKHHTAHRFNAECIVSTRMKIEPRYPLADVNLVEFALALPFDYKIHKGKTRYLFRKVIKDRLPKSIHDNQKLGIPTLASLHVPFINSFEEILELVSRLENSNLFEEIDFDRIKNYLELAYEDFENQPIPHPYTRLFGRLQLLMFLEMEQQTLIVS